MTDSKAPWVDGLTIGQALREIAGRFGDAESLVFVQQGYQATYAELDRQVDTVARGLLSLGLQKDEHFAVWATNRPEWVLLQMATARIGVVLVTVNPACRAPELEYALRQSDARALALIDRFKSSDYFSIFDGACPELSQCVGRPLESESFPELKWVISLSPDPRPGMIGWDELLGRAPSVSIEQLAAREAQLDPGDKINIQYTSGTTGLPKGAMLTHRNLLLNAFYAGECQNLSSADRICIPVPLYHCFGCVLGTLCGIAHGAAMIFPYEYFDAGETLDATERERATAIYGVPTMFIAQLEHENYPRRDLSSLRTGIMAGSPCPVELMKRVSNEMGASEITIGYGQTEASPLVTQTRTDDSIELRVGTVGRAIPGVELKIIDPETGDELPDGQSGELCSRGHGRMLGYYNMPEQTAEAIDSEGWLHSGDLALREPNGYFRITGRLKDMIIRGGENISPREIEEHLYKHPQIEEVQVVGVPDKKFGEQILACIKLRSGETLSEDEVREFCRSSLAHYKIPRYVQLVSEYPMTVTGKIQKFKLREQAIEQLGLQDAAGIETA